MGSIKDRNGRDLTETEDIQKTWQEYKEELQKKDLHDLDNHNGVITHLEPDILECEVKWALGSITMNTTCDGNGIPVQLFQMLKDDAVKVLHSNGQQIWKTQQWPQNWKNSVFIPIPKKGNAKLFMTVKEESEKVRLKLNNQKTKIMASSLISSGKQIGKQLEQRETLFWLGSKITADDCSHEIKRGLSLEQKL